MKECGMNENGSTGIWFDDECGLDMEFIDAEIEKYVKHMDAIYGAEQIDKVCKDYDPDDDFDDYPW